MTSGAYIARANGLGSDPTEAELSELERLRDRFQGHYIYRHVTGVRGVRYAAYGATIGARPHTIITSDLSELRYELEASQRQLGLCLGAAIRRQASIGVAMAVCGPRQWPVARVGDGC